MVDKILALSDVAPTTASLAATTSTSEISLGGDSINLLSASGDIHVRIGVTGMGAASASYTRIPANTLFWLYLNRNHTHVRLYNPGASAITYHLTPAYKN